MQNSINQHYLFDFSPYPLWFNNQSTKNIISTSQFPSVPFVVKHYYINPSEPICALCGLNLKKKLNQILCVSLCPLWLKIKNKKIKSTSLRPSVPSAVKQNNKNFSVSLRALCGYIKKQINF